MQDLGNYQLKFKPVQNKKEKHKGRPIFSIAFSCWKICCTPTRD